MNATVVVRLPVEHKHQLQRESFRKKSTMSHIIRQALDSHWAKGPQKKENFLLRLGKNADKKRVPDAPKDLSTTYKQSLYGI